MNVENRPWPEAVGLAEALRLSRTKIVFAESCTAGLVSAELATVPGISEHLCGSWVTYREASKTDWLQVPSSMLQTFTAVSGEVTQAMARSAIMQTREADWGAAITGHLGPDAPDLWDGVCFLAITRRHHRSVQVVQEQRHVLQAKSRIERQHEAARWLLASCSSLVRRTLSVD